MFRALFSFFTRSIALRLVTAFVLFLMPILFVVGQLVAKQNEEIAFSKRELIGTHFLRPALQVHAAFVEASAQHSRSRRATLKGDPFLLMLSEENRKHGDLIDAARFVDDVSAAVREFNTADVKDAWQVKSYIKSSRTLITEIAEKSNLILDPELDTYYLMEVIALRASPLIEQINTYALIKQNADGSLQHDYAALARQEGMLRSLQLDFSRSFTAAMKAGVQTQQADLLRRMHSDVVTTIDRLIATDVPYDAQMNSRAARQSILRAVLISNDQLVVLLEARIKKVAGQQQVILFGAGILFLCSVILGLAILQGGIVIPLRALTDAMKKVASGEHNVEPPSRDRKDEIGDMARALEVFRENAIARIQAEHAAAAKAEFLAVMSHEIRTPMNGVMGMAQALSSTKLEVPQRKMLAVIQESGDTLLALLNDILDMSKIEAGKLDLESIPFAPERLLQSARDLFDERAAQKGLQLVTKIEPGSDVWRMGDPARLRQIIFNLVSNAIKFTEAGMVTLHLAKDQNDAMIIEVRDTGIGIPASGLSRLFSAFTQVDSSHTRMYGGSGLGLSIAKAIVDVMNGEITVASEVDVGSCFTIVLPLDVTMPPAGQEASPIAPPSSPICRELVKDAQVESDTVQVLVAEDNATNRFVILTLLEGIGITPSFAENGQEALDVWQQAHFDVILMDMQMPVMDGLTAIKTIREIEAAKSLPRIPIVALTANAMPHQVQQQVNAGADTHAAKPIQLATLVAAIEEAIDLCDAFNQEHQSSDQAWSAAADKAA